MNASIYKNGRYGDCSLDGISARHDSVTLVNIPDFRLSYVSEEIERKALADAPPVFLESHVRGVVRLVPAIKGPDGKWQPDKSTMWAFGGAYVSTSDSRLSDAIERLLGHRFYGAIALHDRAMNKERRFGHDD